MGMAGMEEEEAVVVPPLDDKVEQGEGASNSSDRTELEKDPEPTFDTGFVAWLQVLGSFFLFFNSWYVFVRYLEAKLSPRILHEQYAKSVRTC